MPAPSRTQRARPLSADDRRAAIIDAVVPLLLTHGQKVTSRQIAEAAGIAEGTIYRVFEDKESLIRAAVARRMDPLPFRAQVAAIDVDLSLEDKVRRLVVLLTERFGEVFRLMAALGHVERPPEPASRAAFHAIVAGVFEPDRDRLTVPPERAAHYLRLVTFSASLPALNDDHPFTVDELTRLVLTGLSAPDSQEHPC